MILKNLAKILFPILLISFFANQGCASIAPTSISLPVTPVANKTETPTAINISRPTKTLTTDFSLTADFMETASMKDIIITDIPTITATTTPVPLGVFAFFFYSPLVMNYDPSVWELKNTLQAKELASCYIAEQGPTDFNGPHTIQVMQLGNVKYEVLSFPDSSLSQGVVSKAYIAEQALATEWGLPVFWISAKLDEWDKCKPLGEKVLATLHSPNN